MRRIKRQAWLVIYPIELIEFAPMGDNGEEFQKYMELVLLMLCD